MNKNRVLGVILLALICLVAAAMYWLSGRSAGPNPVNEASIETSRLEGFTKPYPGFTGVASCIECHQDQYQLWRGSHHDLAMQVATENTVLGDFDDSRFEYFTVISRFYRDRGRFMVNTDGPDGVLQDYEIKYTFGVFPLQQYLIEVADGKLQALGVAWDSRPASEGGQRWFHLYPEEQVDYRDELHWTALNQNWNYMCAECHSTQLRKNYNAVTGGFETSWSEINVACEACHGPGATHLRWAEGNQEQRLLDQGMGLDPLLRERTNVFWSMDLDTGTAQRSEALTSQIEINTCARCHSRRGVVTENYLPAAKFMDTHRPALLDEGLYYPDGQILDEVYVYGSFRQSKMYHAGVTCSDCHEVHSLKLRGTRETVCLQCHLAEKFASESHHFHPLDSTGASCVGCHMPEKKYMVVDPRYDHSIRIPRPDLTVKQGVPNACNQCHADQTPQWSVDYVSQWYPDPATGYQDYANALAAGRRADPEAPGLLIELIAREDQPAIARATALNLLGQFPVPQSLQAISDSLYDEDPVVRLSGVQALQAMQPGVRYQLAGHLLKDPIRSVKIEAARVLVDTPQDQFNSEQKSVLAKAVDEYIESLKINAERPEAQVSMGNLFAKTGQFSEAEIWFRAAVASEQRFAPAYVNLADMYRISGREQGAQQILRQGLERLPDAASLHHALGLSLVRDQQLQVAIGSLAKAAELESNNSRYGYIYAVALDATGKTAEAINVLARIYNKDNNAQQVLSALISYLKKAGRVEEAASYQAAMDSWQQRLNTALQRALSP